MKKVIQYSFVFLALSFFGIYATLWYLDKPQTEGNIAVSGLSAPVTVYRDNIGIPYIIGENQADTFKAQGWITAQDRLFQLELMRMLAYGRLSEITGYPSLKQDILIRAIDLPKLAKQQQELLSPSSIQWLQHYADGINAYINTMQHEFPLSMKALDNNIDSWTVTDLLAVTHFSNWAIGGYFEHEILQEQLIAKLGENRAKQIAGVFPDPRKQPKTRAVTLNEAITNELINKNLNASAQHTTPEATPYEQYNLYGSDDGISYRDQYTIGSNTWAISGEKTLSGKPIVANDTHLDSRRLPGRWMPIALFAKDFKAIGITSTNFPGIIAGRTNNIAWGVTNSYADMVDIYEEKVDPENPNAYFNRYGSKPFLKRTETFKIRDRKEENGYKIQKLVIRSTDRGPIISDLGVLPLLGFENKLLSLRTGLTSFPQPNIGYDQLMAADSIESAKSAIVNIQAPINFAIADQAGNIGLQASGTIPLRIKGDGGRFQTVGPENWQGTIAGNMMPSVTNPKEGWAAAANQNIASPHYPYHYHSWVGHTYRHNRIAEILSTTDRATVDNQSALQNDTKNMLAASLVPLLAPALLNQTETKALGEILNQWNFKDDKTLAAPTIFQRLFFHYARHTLRDEVGDTLFRRLISAPYFWQGHLQEISKNQRSRWFDNIDTSGIEKRDIIIVRAAKDTINELSNVYQNSNPNEWTWGKFHKITFDSPIVPGKVAAFILGAGTHSISGSGETLMRATYSPSNFNYKQFEVKVHAAARLIVDMGDQEKISMVISGGSSGRQFNQHLDDQVKDWLDGEMHPVWITPELAKENAKSTLVLKPTE